MDIFCHHGAETWECRPLSSFFEGLGEPFRRYLPAFDYLFHNFNALPDEEINLPPPIKSSFMSIFDIYEAKGLEKGLEKGIEQGIEQGLEKGLEKGKAEKTRQACANMIRLGFDGEAICKVLEVTPEFVEAVRREMGKEGAEE